MKKKGFSELDDDLRPEYFPEDFAGMTPERGKFARMLRRRSNVVRIAPDVHAVFPNETAVNRALRALIARRKAKQSKGGKAKRAAR
jgi:hypothetical protein